MNHRVPTHDDRRDPRNLHPRHQIEHGEMEQFSDKHSLGYPVLKSIRYISFAHN